MGLQEILELGRKATQLFDNAKEALTEFADAAQKVGPTLAETDLAKLKEELERVHTKTLAMGAELDAAIAAQLD